MTSLSYPDGQPCLEFGDGLPFGHELVRLDATDNIADADRTIQRSNLLASYKEALCALTTSDDEDDTWRRKCIDTSNRNEYLSAHNGERWMPDRAELVRYISHIAEPELARFLRDNVAAQPARQRRLEAMRPSLEAEVIAGVERLKEVGLATPAIASMYEHTIMNSQVVASDAFDASGEMASGYCTDDGRISLAPSFSRDPEAVLRDTMLHEYTHAIGVHYGSGFSFNETDLPLLEEVVASYWSGVAFDEGIIPDSIIPDGVSTIMSYHEERKLVGTLMLASSGLVTVTKIRDAYFSSGKTQQAAIREIVQGLDNAVRETLPTHGSWQAVEDEWFSSSTVNQPRLVHEMQQIIDDNLGMMEFSEDELPQSEESSPRVWLVPARGV